MSKIVQLKDGTENLYPVTMGKRGTFSLDAQMYAAGFITSGSTELAFFLPIGAASGTVTINTISLTCRFTDGVYGYIRSGTNGGTYTQLSGAVIRNNGAYPRTNEVDSITATVINGGIRISIKFKYAIAKTSGNTTAVTNNTPVAVAVNGNFTIS